MQYLDTASVVLGALAGMADTPAARLPRGSYFTEALIREILRTSALRRSTKLPPEVATQPTKLRHVADAPTTHTCYCGSVVQQGGADELRPSKEGTDEQSDTPAGDDGLSHPAGDRGGFGHHLWAARRQQPPLRGRACGRRRARRVLVVLGHLDSP